MNFYLSFTTLICFAFFCFPHISAEGLVQTENSILNEETISEPKTNVAESAICKKCSCDINIGLIDCSKRNLTQWFSDEEWRILQQGDVTFDTINLEHNSLTTIPELPTYPVSNLFLAFNEIVNIDKGAFQNLNELTKLDLSHNNITSKVLIPDVFKGKYSPSNFLPLENMRVLNLGHNELHNLDPDLFEHLPYLEELVLCKNTFKVIDHLTETAIAGLTSLKTLDLSYMALDDLPDHLLHGPRSLETLILTGNLLDEIPDNMELGVNLKALVLDENPMGDFMGENIFPYFPSLEYLSISFMPEVSIIDKGALSNLPNLKTLIASNNPKLSSIHPEVFAKVTENPLVFDYPPLEKLYLSYNNLSVLDRELVQRWDEIGTIDLRFNPWACDCTNKWLVQILIAQINDNLPALTYDVKCSTPENVKNTRVVDIKLSCALKSNSIWIYVLVFIFMSVGLIIAILFVYRQGGLNFFNRGERAGKRSLYNRASFTDDFHI